MWRHVSRLYKWVVGVGIGLVVATFSLWQFYSVQPLPSFEFDAECVELPGNAHSHEQLNSLLDYQGEVVWFATGFEWRGCGTPFPEPMGDSSGFVFVEGDAEAVVVYEVTPDDMEPYKLAFIWNAASDRADDISITLLIPGTENQFRNLDNDGDFVTFVGIVQVHYRGRRGFNAIELRPVEITDHIEKRWNCRMRRDGLGVFGYLVPCF